METSSSCNASTLSVYTPSPDNPWNKEKVNHVYRRLCFGASLTEINAALSQTPEQFIDALVDQAIATPVTPAPSWANTTYQDYIDMGLDPNEETQNNHGEWRLLAFNSFLNGGLKARLNLFWSNHFVTQLENYYCSNYLYDYYNLLETFSTGNFKDFVTAIGKNEAMLIYLNGFENSANAPNENYARELYELFTLGLNNGYNQTDIVETAKALTGYNQRNGFCNTISFNPGTFNATNKTIFERTGNWGYDDVITILFEEKAPLIAKFICEKLYKYFVSSTINEDVVNDMTAIFVIDFNIANVLRTLFKSQHFFDSKTLGSIIKSPFDLSQNFINVTGFNYSHDFKNNIMWVNNTIGQRLFDPIDVAGWQGDRDWINSSTLTGRWQLCEYMIWTTWSENPEFFRSFALETSNESMDPYIITKAIIDRFVPKALHTTLDYTTATDIFKYNIPENYYTDGIWSLYFEQAPYQVLLLLMHVTKMPEFQLK